MKLNFKTTSSLVFAAAFTFVSFGANADAMQSGDSKMQKKASKKSAQQMDHHHESSFKDTVHRMMPHEKIEIHRVKNSIALNGHATSAEAAAKIERLARQYYGENVHIMNFMHINSPMQVMLRVRIGEVKTKDMGMINHNMKDGFEVLEKSRLVKILAEPNLVALSGEQAEFLAGGEYPVPVMQAHGNMAIDYKQYGIKVAFTPYVLSPHRIKLNVEPEFSEINKEHSSGNMPSFTSRKAKTTVELAPGESFMIAGLTSEIEKGGRREGTEIVISVTPYLVNPIPNKEVRFPTDVIHVSSPLEKKFVNKITSTFTAKSPAAGKVAVNNAKQQPVLEGPSGFIAE